jgi:putative chitinase
MAFTLSKGTATALSDMNIRREQPSSKLALIARAVAKGTTIPFVGWVDDGEEVSGSRKWFKTVDGNYFWSGNVSVVLDRVPSTFRSITVQQLASIVSNIANIESLVGFLNVSMEKFDISSPVRQCMFLAQLACESKFKIVSEDLYYSASRLTVVWPARFTVEKARLYEHQPEKLANYVYAGRNGNGDEASGDGWRFRGRGLIQLTGRDKYFYYGRMIGADLVAKPDLAATPEIAAMVAGAYWKDRGLNELADKGDFREITRKINGGYNGLSDRLAFLALAQKVIT